MFGYTWRSVSAAGGTDCSWEWDSNLPWATDNYLSWDSNPDHCREERAVLKQNQSLGHSGPLNWHKQFYDLIIKLNCVICFLWVISVVTYMYVYSVLSVKATLKLLAPLCGGLGSNPMRVSCQLLMEGCWFTPRNILFLQLRKLIAMYNQTWLKNGIKHQINDMTLLR